MRIPHRGYGSKLNAFIDQYREAHGGQPFQMRDVAAWAIREGLWEPPIKSAVDILAHDLSQAARVEYVTDVQGRRVRRLHARKVEVKMPSGELKQETFWDDITTAPPEHMLMAFQQRRRIVLNDCHQLKTDVDSYNENWNQGEQLELSYDFTEDLAEMDMGIEYPDSPEDENKGIGVQEV